MARLLVMRIGFPLHPIKTSPTVIIIGITSSIISILLLTPPGSSKPGPMARYSQDYDVVVQGQSAEKVASEIAGSSGEGHGKRRVEVCLAQSDTVYPMIGFG